MNFHGVVFNLVLIAALFGATWWTFRWYKKVRNEPQSAADPFVDAAGIGRWLLLGIAVLVFLGFINDHVVRIPHPFRTGSPQFSAEPPPSAEPEVPKFDVPALQPDIKKQKGEIQRQLREFEGKKEEPEKKQ